MLDIDTIDRRIAVARAVNKFSGYVAQAIAPADVVLNNTLMSVRTHFPLNGSQEAVSYALWATKSIALLTEMQETGKLIETGKARNWRLDSREVMTKLYAHRDEMEDVLRMQEGEDAPQNKDSLH